MKNIINTFHGIVQNVDISNVPAKRKNRAKEHKKVPGSPQREIGVVVVARDLC